MLEEKGVVIAVEDQLVWVQTQIKSTCGSCHAKENCATGAIAQAFSAKPNVISIRTEQSLEVGDKVILGIEESFVLRSSFYVYLLPIVGFMVFAYGASILFTPVTLTAELISVLSAFFGGWLGFLLARRLVSKLACRGNDQVKLLSAQRDQIPIQFDVH